MNKSRKRYSNATLYTLKKWINSAILTIIFIVFAFSLMGLSILVKKIANSVKTETIDEYNITNTIINEQFSTYPFFTTVPFYKELVFAENKTQYARIKDECSLYKTNKTDDNSQTNIYFELPTSYFVEIIKINTETKIANVRYNKFIGFCDSTKLTFIDWLPTSPFQTNNITIKENSGTQLRSSADASSAINVISIIPAKTSNIEYISYINGATPTDGTSNIWYFCIYNESSTIVHLGYIYSERATLSVPFSLNTETDPNAVASTSGTNIVTDENTSTSINSSYEIPKDTKIVLIIVFSIPALAIFILLVKKPKIKKQEKEATNLSIVSDNLSTNYNNTNTSIKKKHSVFDNSNIANEQKQNIYDKLTRTNNNKHEVNNTNSKTKPKQKHKTFLERFFVTEESSEFSFPIDDEPL